MTKIQFYKFIARKLRKIISVYGKQLLQYGFDFGIIYNFQSKIIFQHENCMHRVILCGFHSEKNQFE